jgi:hypothetical protein
MSYPGHSRLLDEAALVVDPAIELGAEHRRNLVQSLNQRLWWGRAHLRSRAHDADDPYELVVVTEQRRYNIRNIVSYIETSGSWQKKG